MTVRTFTAVLYKEDDLYVAECPEVGTASQGHSIEQATANLKEATELYLEEFPMPEGIWEPFEEESRATATVGCPRPLFLSTQLSHHSSARTVTISFFAAHIPRSCF